MARRLGTLGLTLLLVACSRPRPSPEYDRARALWGEIVRDRPGAPADDPRADEVLRLLGAVPRDSADAPDAAALRDRVALERFDGAEERARREDLARRAGPAPAPPGPPGPPEPRGAGEPGGGDAPAGGGAKPAPPPALAVGTKVEDFRAAYGSCFAPGGPVRVVSDDRAARAGEMWVMKDDAGCREAHPSLVGQTVLFTDGAVAGVSPVAAVKRVEVRREVQLAPLPDGTTGMVVDGAVVPLPPGATLLRSPGAAR